MHSDAKKGSGPIYIMQRAIKLIQAIGLYLTLSFVEVSTSQRAEELAIAARARVALLNSCRLADLANRPENIPVRVPAQKFVKGSFINAPAKCGTSALASWIQHYNSERNFTSRLPRHVPAYAKNKTNDELCVATRTVSFVRDPFERLASAALELMASRHMSFDTVAKAAGEPRNKTDRPPPTHTRVGRYQAEIWAPRIDAFANSLINDESLEGKRRRGWVPADVHVSFQAAALKQVRPRVTYIGDTRTNFEELDGLFDHKFDSTALSTTTSYSLKRRRAHLPYKHEFPPDLARKICVFFAVDVCCLDPLFRRRCEDIGVGCPNPIVTLPSLLNSSSITTPLSYVFSPPPMASHTDALRTVAASLVHHKANLSHAILPCDSDDALKSMANHIAPDSWISMAANLKSGGYVSHRRRIRTLELALAVLAMNVPGDFVETGTHVGGTATLLMKVLMSFDDRERLFWGADSFQGLPEGGAGDMVDRNIFSFSNTKFRTPGAIAIRRGQFRAGKQQFFDTLKDFDAYDPARLQVLEGWFNETLPTSPISSISFLRLDGDIYASTRDAIDALYERVSPGGFVYVDDYGSFLGCRNAIEEFREKHGITAAMHAVFEGTNLRTGQQQFEAVWWQKPLLRATSNHLRP